MMNHEIQNVIVELPAGTPFHVIHQKLFKNLGGLFFATIERWSKAPGTPAEIWPIEKSIYRDVGHVKPNENFLRDLFPFKSYYASGLFRINDIVFGDDKLGHFLQVGYIMYFAVKRKQDPNFKDARSFLIRMADKVSGDEKFREKSPKQGLELVYAYSRYMEDNQWGMKGSMARSYGDIAANVEGFKFWSDLTEGDRPYLKMNTFGQWEQVRSFDWTEYVSHAWDEGVNRSDFYPSIEERVEARIQEVLGSRCDSLPSCSRIIEKYGADSVHIINPKVLIPICQALFLSRSGFGFN